MNGKLVVLGIVVIVITIWLLQGWQAANQASSEVGVTTNMIRTTASSTPSITYRATTSDQEVVLDINAKKSLATMRGLGYGALPLRATTTASGTIYINTNERVRVVPQDNYLQILVAETELFAGRQATTTSVD